MQKRNAARIGLVILSMAFCAAAQALSFRTYLSVQGSDGNPCTVQLPCRLIPAALAQVVDGGEIWMLDSANYNTSTVDITKSVTILAIPGAVGSVVATGGAAITISTNPGSKVTLRNLVILPLPASGGLTGISMTNGASLTIEGSLVANIPNAAINVDSASSPRVRILDSVIRNNGTGLYLRNGARADIANSKFVGNSFGLYVDGMENTAVTTAAVSDSVFSGNMVGLLAISNFANSTVRWMATRTTASNNSYGFSCEATNGGIALCTAGYSMATGNTEAGFFNSGGTFRSLGNNIVTDNTTNTSGTITPVAGT
jgi:hypothetical protein